MSKIGYPVEPSPQIAGGIGSVPARTVAAPAIATQAPPWRPAALVAGPVLVTAGFALHPVGAEDGTAFVRTVASHPSGWAVAHLLIFAGLLALVATVPLVLDLAPRRGRRIVHAGIAALSIGAIAMAVDAIAHGYLAYVLAGRHDVGARLSAAIETHAANTSWASTASALGALFPLGVVLIAVGCVRAGVSKLVAASLVAGVVGIGMVGAGPATVLTTAPLVLGFAGLARAWMVRPSH
jgi:hypothetical protein